jgi:ankyrin repeat protein
MSNVQLLKWLLQLTLQNGDTALHIAAAMGRRKLTRILLEAGCDKSLKNKVRKCG